MKITRVSTDKAPAPGGHYSQGISDGSMLWTSGVVGVDPSSGTAPEGFAAQAEQALRNLGAIVDASGATLSDVVKTTCFITDLADFTEFNTIYADFFGDHRPARSTFVVGLAGGFLFEIEAVVTLRG